MAVIRTEGVMPRSLTSRYVIVGRLSLIRRQSWIIQSAETASILKARGTQRRQSLCHLTGSRDLGSGETVGGGDVAATHEWCVRIGVGSITTPRWMSFFLRYPIHRDSNHHTRPALLLAICLQSVLPRYRLLVLAIDVGKRRIDIYSAQTFEEYNPLRFQRICEVPPPGTGKREAGSPCLDAAEAIAHNPK
jgi:hypothetical protein